MKELIVVLVFLYAVAAIFLLTGYATGRIKHRFAAIICLVAIASAPFLIFLRLPVRLPAWRTYDHLVEVTTWATLFPILAIAGHVMGRTASSRSVFLARVTVCACLLIFSGYVTLSWGYSTHILNAGFRHQEHFRVGHWEFWLPSRWYGEHDVRWQQLGAKDALELRRSSWSSVPDQSVVRIITPVSSTVHLHLNDIRMVQDQRFQIEGAIKNGVSFPTPTWRSTLKRAAKRICWKRRALSAEHDF